jgi:hypothetical protein
MAVGDGTQGRRLSNGSSIEAVQRPGDYLLLPDRDAVWCVLPIGTVNRIPVNEEGQTSDPVAWGLIEHEDGTISLTPSILCHAVPDYSQGWHGYLERGVWREV